MPQFTTPADLFDACRAAWSADNARRAVAKDLLAVYDNDWTEQLDDELKQLFVEQNYEKLKDREDTSLNLLRWAAEQMAIYAKPAQRSIDELDDIEPIAPYEAGGTLDMALDEISQLLFCVRELALRPMVVGEYGVSYLVMDVVTPDKFTVIPNDKNPLTIDAICIELPQKNASRARYSVWTDTEHYLLGPGWKPIASPTGEDVVNPYGVNPYVMLHASYPVRGIWHQNQSAGLYEATLQTGVQKTDFNHIMHHQSFKQLAVLGEAKDINMTNAIIDPTVALKITGKGPDVKMLDWQAKLQEHHDVLLSSAASTMAMYGFRPEAIKGTIDASSGYALKIKNHTLEIARGKYRRAWTLWEQRIYATSRIIWESANAGSPLPDGLLIVQHADLQPEADPLAQAELAEKLLNVGFSHRRVFVEVFDKDTEWIETNQTELEEETVYATMDSPPPNEP